jgi:tetratricopeptide (TPR) repeat protein
LVRPINRLVEDYAADVVVINYKYSPPLLRGLARHPIWELVHVEGPYATFARLEGSQSEVVRAESLAALPDVDAYVRHQRKLDPVLRAALLHPGIVYLKAGLGELAIATFTAIVRERPDRTVAWNYLGLGYVARAMSEPENKLADLEAARKAFDSALELDPGNEIARANIRNLTAPEERLENSRSRALEDEQRGRDPL